MEDFSVKTNITNPATGASASAATLKDAGNSPAEVLALAFSQFLRKAAAQPDQILAGARGKVIPFEFASSADWADTNFDRAGFEPAENSMSRPDAAPAPSAPREDHSSSPSDRPKPADTSTPASRENAEPSTTPEEYETHAGSAQTVNATAAAPAETKNGVPVQQVQPKGQALETAESDDRGRGRKKKSASSATTKDTADVPKEHAETVLSGLILSVKPGEGEEHAHGQAQGPAEQANEAADDQRDFAGIANALSQLAKQTRGQARTGSNQNQEDATEEDKEAAKKTGASIETRARQAADLAERIGAGTRMSVEVEVAENANSLTSRPMAALIASHDEKNAGAARARLGIEPSTATNEQALSAVAQSDGAEAIAERFAALAGISGLNAVSQATAAADESALQLTAQGVAPGSGPSARATEAPAQTNATQNAQRPAASFRSEVLEQVSVTIQKAIKDGADHITVQLRPAELGRIEVRIEVAGDGRTLVHVAAERSDTLELLQRDARDLARALQDAGLRADAGNLQFSLREQTAENRERRGRSGGATGAGLVERIASEVGSAPAWAPTVLPGRVDIRA